MKNLSILFLVLLLSCSQPSQTENELMKVLNSPLHFGGFDTIHHRDSISSLQQLFDRYEYVSVYNTPQILDTKLSWKNITLKRLW